MPYRPTGKVDFGCAAGLVIARVQSGSTLKLTRQAMKRPNASHQIL